MTSQATRWPGSRTKETKTLPPHQRGVIAANIAGERHHPAWQKGAKFSDAVVGNT